MDPSSGGGLKSQSSTWGRSGKRWCSGGSSFATAFTHAYEQCLAITPPAVTRPSAHPGCRGVSDNPEAAPHRRVGMSRVESERRARSERGQSHCQASITFRKRHRRFGGRLEGRQLRDSICSRVPAAPRHHAATSDNVNRRRGRSGDRLDSETNDIRPAQDRDRWPPRFVSGRQWTHHRVAD